MLKLRAGSKKWPRPLYAKTEQRVWQQAAIALQSEFGGTADTSWDGLVDRFCAVTFEATDGANLDEACEILQQLKKQCAPRVASVVNSVAMTDCEIKQVLRERAEGGGALTWRCDRPGRTTACSRPTRARGSICKPSSG